MGIYMYVVRCTCDVDRIRRIITAKQEARITLVCNKTFNPFNTISHTRAYSTEHVNKTQYVMESVYRIFLTFSVPLIAFLAFSEAKVLRGTVSSLQAWREHGQFVSKFCFHGIL